MRYLQECGSSRVKTVISSVSPHTSLYFLVRSIYRIPTALSSPSQMALPTSASSLSFSTRWLGSDTGDFSCARPKELRFRRDHLLLPLLRAKRSRLQDLQVRKEALDQIAHRSVDRLFFAIFAVLLVQFVVLFDWTYIHFDWNFVEPITYLLSYCETWIALAWYGNMHSEYEYDSLRELLERKRRNKLYVQHALEVSELNQLKDEVEILEGLVRALEGID
ncbi:unnamed protein product [Phytomonas sp. EM1]|nr:unnamed protein product [Phytomonas sp. EM1]|eukprot:CCW63803.1 unnamed protein product [Phytomonas sp. isolate EM1]